MATHLNPTNSAATAPRPRRFALAAAGTTLLAVAGMGAAAWAQTATEDSLKVTMPAKVLSVGDIESHLAARGMKVKEIEVRDLLAEVEGYDSQGRKIEVVVDRRNGELLSHKYDR